MEDAAPADVRVTREGDMLRAQATMDGTAFEIHSPAKPVTRAQWNGFGVIDGVTMNETYGLPPVKI